jgi:cytochrome c biogenesis protein CcmG, thiol:disulfide interchange protein DsbE
VEPGKKTNIDLMLKVLIGILTVAMIVVVSGTLEQKVIDKGDTAPNFNITADQGPTVSRDFKGKLLVLNFWATWCPPCIEEWPSLNEFAAKYKDKGVVVVGVSVDRNEKKYREFLARNKPSFLTARDPESNIPASYGTFMYPETYIIDQKGKVLFKIANAQNWMDPAFLNYLQTIL